MSILNTIEQQRKDAEAEVSRLKALCEELRGALEKIAEASFVEFDDLEPDDGLHRNSVRAFARAALKKAEQAPKP